MLRKNFISKQVFSFYSRSIYTKTVSYPCKDGELDLFLEKFKQTVLASYKKNGMLDYTLAKSTKTNSILLYSNWRNLEEKDAAVAGITEEQRNQIRPHMTGKYTHFEGEVLEIHKE